MNKEFKTVWFAPLIIQIGCIVLTVLLTLWILSPPDIIKTGVPKLMLLFKIIVVIMLFVLNGYFFRATIKSRYLKLDFDKKLAEKDAAHQAQIKQINDNCKNEISKQGNFLLQKYEEKIRIRDEELRKSSEENKRQESIIDLHVLTIGNLRYLNSERVKTIHEKDPSYDADSDIPFKTYLRKQYEIDLQFQKYIAK